MKRVIIESPFAGDIQANINYARQCAKDCVARGEVPFASHLFFPQFLDENKPEERQLGIEMGYDFWDKADLIVFYMDRGLSPGMEKALLKAFTEDRRYERRLLQPCTTTAVHIPAEVAKFAPKTPVDMGKLAKDIAQK